MLHVTKSGLQDFFPPQSRSSSMLLKNHDMILRIQQTRKKNGGGEISHMIPKKVSPKHARHVKRATNSTHALSSQQNYVISIDLQCYPHVNADAHAAFISFAFATHLPAVHKSTPKRCMGRLTENKQNNEQQRCTERVNLCYTASALRMHSTLGEMARLLQTTQAGDRSIDIWQFWGPSRKIIC
uniref:Bm336 n=1 Tax=Brugia malayi TaxID=6279 RepID=A0A1I9G0Z9_BRUMA|nr:Bm336 [Brugia malayi]